MSVDMFMKVEGATGESKDSNHKGWTDIDSFTWGAKQPNSMASGGGAGAGKVAFQDLIVIAKMDRCYPAMVKHCATGKHLGKVELSLCKAGGTQIEYARIELTDVLVTAVNLRGIEGGEIFSLAYCFQASKIKTSYWEQTSQGGRAPGVDIGFDIKQNKEA
jgi:type VI secretion system secreted protein Hcp